MRLNPFILSSAAAITLGCVVTAAAYYYRSRNKEINDVMVFCKLQFNAWNCFDKLMSYIEAAKRSVDVCMPSIHIPAIQGRLLKLMVDKKIKVRIIIDKNGYKDSTGFFLKELIEAGAEIKCSANEPYNPHRKFCLIDDKILMTGTLNWGDDQSGDGWNYVYVTNKPSLVEPVKTLFYNMWRITVDLEEAIKFAFFFNKMEEESEDSTAEIVSDNQESDSPDISPQDKVSDNHEEPCQMPFIRETQATPEFCIT